jgi:cation transport protein ChaC
MAGAGCNWFEDFAVIRLHRQNNSDLDAIIWGDGVPCSARNTSARSASAAEHRPAFVRGWHRALRMASRINRGTPERPGLVFALLPGGSCHGAVYRVPRTEAGAALEDLWQREMPTGVYDPRWLPCRTGAGVVRALAFTLSRKSPQHTGRLNETQLIDILRHSSGRYGSTLDYLLATARCLAERGVRDREIERMVALSKRHGLVG